MWQKQSDRNIPKQSFMCRGSLVTIIIEELFLNIVGKVLFIIMETKKISGHSWLNVAVRFIHRIIRKECRMYAWKHRQQGVLLLRLIE